MHLPVPFIVYWLIVKDYFLDLPRCSNNSTEKGFCMTESQCSNIANGINTGPCESENSSSVCCHITVKYYNSTYSLIRLYTARNPGDNPQKIMLFSSEAYNAFRIDYGNRRISAKRSLQDREVKFNETVHVCVSPDRIMWPLIVSYSKESRGLFSEKTYLYVATFEKNYDEENEEKSLTDECFSKLNVSESDESESDEELLTTYLKLNQQVLFPLRTFFSPEIQNLRNTNFTDGFESLFPDSKEQRHTYPGYDTCTEEDSTCEKTGWVDSQSAGRREELDSTEHNLSDVSSDIHEHSESDVGSDIHEHGESDVGSDIHEHCESDVGSDIHEHGESDVGSDIHEHGESDVGSDIHEHGKSDVGSDIHEHNQFDVTSDIHEHSQFDVSFDIHEHSQSDVSSDIHDHSPTNVSSDIHLLKRKLTIDNLNHAAIMAEAARSSKLKRRRKTVETHPTHNMRKPVKSDATHDNRKPVKSDATHDNRKPVKSDATIDNRKPVKSDATHDNRKPVKSDVTHDNRKPVKSDAAHNRKPVKSHASHNKRKPVKSEATHDVRKPVSLDESHDLRWPVIEEDSDHRIVNKENEIPKSFIDMLSKSNDPLNCKSKISLSKEQLKNYHPLKLDILHDLWKEANEECGDFTNTSQKHVITPDRNWPWMVSLLEKKSGKYRNKCSGALLTNEWVLTVAHCVDMKYPSDFKLLLGNPNPKRGKGKHTEMEISQIVIHKDYKRGMFENDLALLKMTYAVEFSYKIKPICLPEDDDDDVFVDDDSETEYGIPVFLSWRRKEKSDYSPNNVVPLIENSECESMYSVGKHKERIKDTFICAGKDDGNCDSESGSSLVAPNLDDRWMLLGLVSWGSMCSNLEQPSVYTRIVSYVDWIKQIIACYELFY